MPHPTDRITHTTVFVTPVVEHWLEREIAQWVHPMKDQRLIAPWANAITTELHLAQYINSLTGINRRSTACQVGIYTSELWRERERERNVLFNDTLNTFYLRLYGVRHMVKDHSDSEKGNPLSPHRLLLSINSKGSFICTIPQTG